jgi:hypothetical protein
MRLAERSASGSWAISSGGNSKWKSDFFNAGQGGGGPALSQNPTPAPVGATSVPMLPDQTRRD